MERTMPSRVKPARSRHALRRNIADVHVSGDALDPKRKGVLGQRRAIVVATPRPSRVRQHEIADLDDAALRVEVMERPATDDLACHFVGRGQREESPHRRERGSYSSEATSPSRSNADRFPASPAPRP